LVAETLSQFSAEEGDITTSIVEFKTGHFVRDQTLVELLCTFTDNSFDTLKEGKQYAHYYILSDNLDVALSNMLEMLQNESLQYRKEKENPISY